MSNLVRMLRVGDSLSFDGGRIVLSLEDKSGRTARLRLAIQKDVVIDKPRVAANDELEPYQGNELNLVEAGQVAGQALPPNLDIQPAERR